jgi:hypothetical protein
MVQNWRSLGFTLPDIPATDWRQVRGMLMAAIALPPSAPRDARHQLVPQYLAMLRARTADATDRALLPRLAADPRIAADDLQQLAGLPDARRAEAALLVRIRHGDTKGDDLRRLAHVAYELPVADMPAFLAMLQRLGADPERGREFQSLFEMYTAMERRQAEARREPAAANGAHPAADFGFSGARPLRPLAFALDIAALVALHLTVLALVLIRYRRRLRKGPPPEQPAA